MALRHVLEISAYRQLFKVMRDAETQTSPGGDETSLLHNMTASLAIACFVLGIVSAGVSAAHEDRIMAQARKSLLDVFPLL